MDYMISYDQLTLVVNSLTLYLEGIEQAQEHALTDRVIEQYQFLAFQLRLILGKFEPILDRAKELDLPGYMNVLKPTNQLAFDKTNTV